MGTSRTTTAAIAALFMSGPTVVLAQDDGGNPGGFQVDFGVSSTLRFDDNFELDEGDSAGNSTVWDTTLSFAVSSITPTQSLRLEGSSVLRYADLPGDTLSGIEDPNLRLIYGREGADSRLTFDASYRNSDLDFLDPFEDLEDEDDLTDNDGGSLETKRARLTYEQGAEAPIGFRFSAGYDDRNYTDTTDPDLADSTTEDVEATVSFRVSPVARASLTASREWFTADDAEQTDRETTDIVLGLDYEIGQALTMAASIGYTDIETEEFGILERESGATASISLDRALPNGNATVSLAADQTVNGTRTTLTFGRSLELPRGALAATLGLTRSESGEIDTIGTLDYTYAMKSDTFTVSLDRSATTNDDDEETISTGFTIGYERAINAVSGIDVTFDYRRVEDAGAGTVTTEDTASLRAAYTRALTPDWELEAGALLRYADDSGVPGSARSNQIFVTIGRDFSFRP